MRQQTNMKKNVMWNTMGSTYYSFCQWLMTVIIVYLTEDYAIIGTLGLAMTITNSFTTISSFGMRSFQVSDTKREFTNENFIMSRRITAGVAYLLCGIYGAITGLSLYEWICIMIYMLLRLIESTEDVFNGVFQRYWRFDMIGKSYILRGTTQILSFVGVFAMTKRLELSFGAMVLCNGAILLLSDIPRAKKVAKLKKIEWDFKIMSLLKACSGVVIYNFLFSTLPTTLRVQIRNLLGSEQLGIYSTIASPTVIVQLLAAVAFSPFIPFFSEAYHKGQKKKMKRYLNITLFCMVAAFLIINVVGFFGGKWGLTILYNKDVASHYELLLPLVWCTFLTACVGMFVGIIVSMRKIPFLIWGISVVAVVNQCVGRYFILRFGMNGASYIQALLELFLAIYMFVVVRIHIERLQEEK